MAKQLDDFQSLMLFIAVLFVAAVLSLCSIGCGGCPVDYEVEGLTVCTNGHEATPEMVAFTIVVTEEQYNAKFEENINIDIMLYKHGALLELMSEGDVPPNGGMYYNDTNELLVEARGDDQEFCKHTYWAIGHELLHFVLDKGPDHPGSSYSHTTPGVWKMREARGTVEAGITHHIHSICEEMWTENSKED